MTTNKPTRPIVEATFGEKVQSWYESNGNIINIVLIALLAGVIGYKVFDYYQTRDVARANMAYSTVANQYQTAMGTPDGPEKVDQLQGAITAGEQVVTDFPNKPVGRMAQLMIGNAQYELASSQAGGEGAKTLQQARDSYQKFIDMSSDNMDRAVGYLALGNVLENLSFLESEERVSQDEAIKAYQDALALSEKTYLGKEVKLSLARALSAQNNEQSQAQARKLYEEVTGAEVALLSPEAIEQSEGNARQANAPIQGEELANVMNLKEWSFRQLAEDALIRMK